MVDWRLISPILIVTLCSKCFISPYRWEKLLYLTLPWIVQKKTVSAVSLVSCFECWRMQMAKTVRLPTFWEPSVPSLKVSFFFFCSDRPCTVSITHANVLSCSWCPWPIWTWTTWSFNFLLYAHPEFHSLYSRAITSRYVYAKFKPNCSTINHCCVWSGVSVRYAIHDPAGVWPQNHKLQQMLTLFKRDH